jgi:phosphoribosylformimino-5-aminoimidazole carboxamide ribotide isomerase
MTAQSFQIIPVLDVKGGRAVHAKGGHRDHYQPVRSILHPGSDVIALGRAVRSVLGLETVYLADLDAIAGAPPALEIYQQLLALGLCLWIDCGLTDACSADALLESRLSLRESKILSRSERRLSSPAVMLIAGLETLSGPNELHEIVSLVGADRVVFSLDLFDGMPHTASRARWKGTTAFDLADQAIANGSRRLVLLDLARVGSGRGTGTVELLSQIVAAYPGVEVIVGGGIRGIDEVALLKNVGAAGVLLGSALHDGTIGRRELALFD